MAGLIPSRINDIDIRDNTWLASAEGLEYSRSATLHVASLSAAGGHRVQNWLRSGTPLAIVTAVGATQGQFGLWDTAATDGRQFHYGFLVAPVQLVDNITGTANDPLTGAVHGRGQVIVNRLPVAFNAAHANVSRHFIYR